MVLDQELIWSNSIEKERILESTGRSTTFEILLGMGY